MFVRVQIIGRRGLLCQGQSDSNIDTDGRSRIILKSMERLHTVQETMKALRISRTSLYSLIEKGSIKPIKIGGRTLFPETELTRFIEDLKAKNA